MGDKILQLDAYLSTVAFQSTDDAEQALRAGGVSVAELYTLWQQRQPVLEPGKRKAGSLASSCQIPWLQESVGVIRLFTKTCLEKEEFLLVCDAAREALRLWTDATEQDKYVLIRVQMDHACALTRLGLTRAARQVLEPYVEETFRPAIGRKLKADIFLRLGDILREEAQHAVATAARMQTAEKALEFYRAALQLDPQRLEALLATAATSLILGERGDALQQQAQATAGDVLTIIAKLEEEEGPRLEFALGTAVANAIAGKFDEAYQRYTELQNHQSISTADLAEARYRAQFLAQAWGKPRNFFHSAFPPLQLVVFAGHLPDRGPAAERFPLDAIEAVKQSIREMVKEAGVRVGLVSAAAGADLLFIDALQERKKPVHIVLPWAMEEFRKTSVAPYEPASAPPVWGPMFKAAIAQAATVREIGQSYEPSSSVGWEYMMEVTAGIALHSARASRLDILPMALWDGKPGRGAGGTESFVQFWQGQLRYTPMIIPMPEQPGGRSAYVLRDRPTRSEHSTLKQSVKSMLFADIYGYSKLTEHVIPEFVENFLTRVSELAASSSYAPRLVNTWGDAIYAVFDFAHQAGCFALELTQMIKEGEKEWLAKGLYFEEWVEGQAEPKKQPLSVRVGLHTGPVFMHYDPLVRELGFTGTHVSRAARIEPVAKPGEVYASEEFAALAELGAEIRRQARNGAAPERLDFVCEYAGSLALAKGYPGRFRIYRVIPKRILALDELAEAVHESYCLEARRRGEMTDNNRALRPWQELPDDLKAANRAQVADIPNKLQLLGYELAPSSGLSPSEIVLTDVQVEELSIREHDRWMKDRQLHGWTYAPERDNARKKHPCLIPWEELSDLEKEKDRDTIRNLPRLIEKAGFRVRKSTTQPSS